MIDDEALARFIADNLPLGPAAAVPEVRLHLAAPTSGLRRLALSRPPYWASQWGGGTALARHCLDRPEIVMGRSVLDLGCGGGLVAIAAAMAGASYVTAVDIDPAAMVATRLAAAVNGVSIDVTCGDALANPLPAVDLVLAGDMFYARRLAMRTLAFLDRCLAAGVDVIVGDPGRLHRPVARLRRIAEVPVPDFGQPAARQAQVYALEPRDPSATSGTRTRRRSVGRSVRGT